MDDILSVIFKVCEDWVEGSGDGNSGIEQLNILVLCWDVQQQWFPKWSSPLVNTALVCSCPLHRAILPVFCKNKKPLLQASYAYLNTLHWLVFQHTASIQNSNQNQCKDRNSPLFKLSGTNDKDALLFDVEPFTDKRKTQRLPFNFVNIGELHCWMLMYCLDYLYLIADWSQRSISWTYRGDGEKKRVNRKFWCVLS